MKQVTDYLTKQNPLLLAGAAIAVIAAVYFLARKTVTDVVEGAGGLLSGNNDLTKDTPYEDMGILGTLGAAVDKVAGGATSKIGSWIGGLLASDVHSEDVFYTVTFPGGDRHAVQSTIVSNDGYFNKTIPPYANSRWRLGMDATGKRVAKAA